MGWVKGSDRNFKAYRQKDKERQRKTEENVDRRPVVAPRYESGGEAQALVRPARDRAATADCLCQNLRGQGSCLSTGQAEGCPHAPEEADPSPSVGFRVIIEDLVPSPDC